MRPTGNASRAFSSLVPLLSAGLFSLVACSSAHAAQQGTGGSGFADTPAQSGEAIAQVPECNQTDSTVSCCMKQHPGDPERCGGTPPTQKPNQPNRLPPPGKLEDKSADAKERAKRKELCGDYYSRCVQQGGEDIERGQWGSTQCQSCWEECKKIGYWPAQWDDKPCPGGDR